MREEIGVALARTLDDGRLSRSERKALEALLEDSELGQRELAALRAEAFDAVSRRLRDARGRELLSWLEDVVKALARAGERHAERASARKVDVLFSPGDDCALRLRGLFQATRRRAEVCVYTITDNRIASAIVDAHRRGVQVRVLTDVTKAQDLGSDVASLEAAGIPTAVDTSEKHMHHKFALFDGRIAVTGSYNWTRSAAEVNEENLVVLREPSVIEAFQEEFERLWRRYGAP